MKSKTTYLAIIIAAFIPIHQIAHAQANYFAGANAGASNTSGTFGVFVGPSAGYYNTTGSNNTFIGALAGYYNRSGVGNTFVGSHAGMFSTAHYNTFFGTYAGQLTTTGESNSFFGRHTGASNTTGTRNAFFGHLTGRSNQTGSDNAFLGDRSGYYNTASNNTFVGAQTGEYNTSGALNTFIGRLAGNKNTTAAFNTFIGAVAGDVNTTGASSTFVGHSAGGANTTGQRNSFFGSQAGEFTTTGSDNVFVGRQAGRNNTTGSSNTTLGNYAQLANGTLTNATAIGNKALVRASNSMVLGSINGENGATATIKVGIGTSTPGYLLHVNGTAAKPGGGSWTVASDKRLKKNIKPFTEGLSTLTQVNPVWFQYNGKAGLPTDNTYVGVIAQDMQKIAPHTVGEFTYDNDGQKETYLDYDDNALTYTMVNAIKELNTVNQQLIEEIKKLKEEMALMKGQKSGNNFSKNLVAKLWQNAPNPYASSTIIKYYLPEDVSDAQIEVISMSGQEVYSRQLTERGESQIEISNQMLSSGSYVYQLIVNGTIVDTKKMVVGK